MGEPADTPDNVNPETGELEETDSQPRPFVAFLNDVRHGALVDELREAMAEVVKAVQETEKSGSVTLNLKIGLAEAGGAVVVADDVKSKVPQHTKENSLFFPDSKGDLSRVNPRQMSFKDGLREV